MRGLFVFCRQLLAVSLVVLLVGCETAPAKAGLSTSKKDLERAAELAVERAAEKAAERAVEKALNSGNSSTVTVTVKEGYANAMKTAEEAAAPGSESTRPYDPQIYDRQYGYAPGDAGKYEVYDSAEAEQLGLSKESVNSSIEEGAAAAALQDGDEADSREKEEGEGGGEGGEGSSKEESAESIDASDVSFESGRDEGEKTGRPPGLPGSIKNFEPDFIGGGDFIGGLDLSGDFGMKSNTKTNTFLMSYSKPADHQEGKVEVDEEEDAEIFKMYASDFGPVGWSSTKQEGWVRHRPLWDDSKSRVTRGGGGGGGFWDDFALPGPQHGTRDQAAKSSTVQQHPKEKQKVKRMAEDANGQQVAVPLATLSLDSKAPATIYKLLKREATLVPGTRSDNNMPVKLYVTIPVPYKPAYLAQKRIDAASVINHKMNDETVTTTNEPFEGLVANYTNSGMPNNATHPPEAQYQISTKLPFSASKTSTDKLDDKPPDFVEPLKTA